MGHDIHISRCMVKSDRNGLKDYEMGSRATLERAVEDVRQESGEDSDIYKLGLQRLEEWDNFTRSDKYSYEMGYLGGHGNRIRDFYHAVGKPEFYVGISGIGDFKLTRADLPKLEEGIALLEAKKELLGYDTVLRLVKDIRDALHIEHVKKVKVHCL